MVVPGFTMVDAGEPPGVKGGPIAGRAVIRGGTSAVSMTGGGLTRDMVMSMSSVASGIGAITRGMVSPTLGVVVNVLFFRSGVMGIIHRVLAVVEVQIGKGFQVGSGVV